MSKKSISEIVTTLFAIGQGDIEFDRKPNNLGMYKSRDISEKEKRLNTQIEEALKPIHNYINALIKNLNTLDEKVDHTAFFGEKPKWREAHYDFGLYDIDHNESYTSSTTEFTIHFRGNTELGQSFMDNHKYRKMSIKTLMTHQSNSLEDLKVNLLLTSPHNTIYGTPLKDTFIGDVLTKKGNLKTQVQEDLKHAIAYEAAAIMTLNFENEKIEKNLKRRFPRQHEFKAK